MGNLRIAINLSRRNGIEKSTKSDLNHMMHLHAKTTKSFSSAQNSLTID
jgi:hypothetical protein